MEGAINLKTKEYLLAININLDPSYQFPKEERWLVDPNEILDYDKKKIKDITKVEARYRKGNGKVINWKGTEYSIAPCFFIPNKTNLGINTIPESKEHKLAKNWICNKIKNKKLLFKYSKVNKPSSYDNYVSIEELDINYQKKGIEVTVQNNKIQRADVIIPFNKRDNFFGTGIVIEIQFSKQWEITTEKRSIDWALKGYSICWLWIDDFEKISEDFIELKEEMIQLEVHSNLLANFEKRLSDDFRYKTQNLSRLIDDKLKKLNMPFCIGDCNICGEGYMTIHKNKQNGSHFYSCSNWKEGCKHTISIPKEYENDTD